MLGMDLDDLDFGVDDTQAEEAANPSATSALLGGLNIDPDTPSVGAGTEATSTVDDALDGDAKSSCQAETPDVDLNGKICIGCGCAAVCPSVLCPGPHRLWSHGDFSSQWCRHCANVARARYLGAYSSLAQVAQWISQRPSHQSHFRLRLLAYFSLKTECSTARVNCAMLEQRAGVLETCQQWVKMGPSLGLPAVGLFQRRVFRELKEYDLAVGNPLLADGLLCEAILGGVRCAGALVPESLEDPGRCEVARVFAADQDPGVASACFFTGGKDIRVSDPTTADALRKMTSEYADMCAAQPTEAAPALSEGQGSLCDPSPCKTQLAIVLATPQSPGAMSPGAALGKGLLRAASRGSLGSICEGVNDGQVTPPAKKARTGQSSIQRLAREFEEKLARLSSERWATESCDKNIEGLLTRAKNLRGKMLEACRVEEGQQLGEIVSTVQSIIDLGSAHKRGYGRSKKPQHLIELVQPFQSLADDPRMADVRFHWSLQLLQKQVHFQHLWSEGSFGKALDGIQAQRIAGIFADGCEPLVEHNRLANVWMLDILERIVIEQVRLLKGGKDMTTSLRELLAWLHEVGPRFPTMLALPTTVQYEEQVRVERLQPQVLALRTVVQCALSQDAADVTKPWPSAVRKARATLMDNPQTRVATALQTYGAAKQLMAKVGASLTESEADEFASKAIKGICDAILVADPKSVPFDAYIFQLGEWELVMTNLATECSRLSRLSYEPLHTMLLDSVGLMGTWLSLGESMLQAKVGAVLLAPVQACELASATLSDEHEIPLPDGVSKAIHDIKKALHLIGLSIAGWEGLIASAREKLGNFVKKIVRPLAAERFSEFDTVLARLSEQSEGHERLSKALTVVREGLGAMVGVATSPQAAQPLETAMEAWTEWKNNKSSTEPSQKPFFEDLFVFGQKKSICSEETKWQPTGGMQEVLDFLTEGRLSKLLSEVHVKQRLDGLLRNLEAAVDIKINIISVGAWPKLGLKDAPKLGLVLRHKDLQRFMNDSYCELSERPSAESFDAECLDISRSYNLFCKLVTLFGTATISTSLLPSDPPETLPTSVAMPHLELQYCVTVMSKYCATLAYLCTLPPGGSWEKWLFQPQEGEKRQDKVTDLKLKPEFANAFGQARKILHRCVAIAGSGSFASTESLEVTTGLPAMTARTWAEIVSLFVQDSAVFLVGQLVELSEASGADLASRCPQWQAWATEDTVDQERLAAFVGELPTQVLKRSIVGTFALVAASRTAAEALGVKDGMDANCLKECKERLVRVCDTINVGKTTIALRSAAMAMLPTAKNSKVIATAVLKSLGDVHLPSAVMRALRQLAGE